ncbi:MAG: thioesterase family protein [Thermoleophilaceae bacterium]
MRTSVEPSLDPTTYPFVHRIRVRFAETDAMGIVHHSRYLPYLEEARVEYLRHLDHPYHELRAEGIDMVVLEAFVRYRSPLRFDDLVDVHVALGAANRTTFQMAYLLTVAGHARATAVTVHGSITSADGRPTRSPAWLRELAAPGADLVGDDHQ